MRGEVAWGEVVVVGDQEDVAAGSEGAPVFVVRSRRETLLAVAKSARVMRCGH